MVEVSVRSLLTAHPNGRRMVPSAIPGAERASTELAPSAGNTANLGSVMMALSATSQRPMAEESDTPSGMKISVKEKTLILVAKSGELSGTPSAGPTSTMLPAASAHQIAPQARPILASPALRTPTVVVQATL